MNKIDGNKLGLALGGLLGLFHLAWSMLVLIGWAQPLMNFIMRLHFINMPFMIEKFNLLIAIDLVIVTAAIGYIVGRVFAFICNWVNAK